MPIEVQRLIYVELLVTKEPGDIIRHPLKSFKLSQDPTLAQANTGIKISQRRYDRNAAPCGTGIDINIMCTCKVIYYQALLILYRRNTFRFGSLREINIFRNQGLSLEKGTCWKFHSDMSLTFCFPDSLIRRPCDPGVQFPARTSGQALSHS